MRRAYATGAGVGSITPVFSQLVRFDIPHGFHGVFERTSGPNYILEMVPEGETVQIWTQMITLTGHQGLASNPNMQPQGFAGSIAGGFKKACPESFAATGLGPFQTGGLQPQEGFAALSSCGSVNGDHSETALLIAIKGTADYYTVQWAERGPAVSHPMALADPKWVTRLNQLKPIIICSKTPGEAPPYPSCVAQE